MRMGCSLQRQVAFSACFQADERERAQQEEERRRREQEEREREEARRREEEEKFQAEAAANAQQVKKERAGLLVIINYKITFRGQAWNVWYSNYQLAKDKLKKQQV